MYAPQLSRNKDSVTWQDELFQGDGKNYLAVNPPKQPEHRMARESHRWHKLGVDINHSMHLHCMHVPLPPPPGNLHAPVEEGLFHLPNWFDLASTKSRHHWSFPPFLHLQRFGSLPLQTSFCLPSPAPVFGMKVSLGQCSPLVAAPRSPISAGTNRRTTGPPH